MNNTQKTKKLQLRVKYHRSLPLDSAIKKFLYNTKLRNKVDGLGLKDLSIKHHDGSNVELEVIGAKDKLWEVVKASKDLPLSYKVKEVSFEFIDVVVAA